MASQQSQGAESPSASSIFLPLGRRGSRASISTQNERENLNAALDQIHTAAYHSDALTVFNEFASPPPPKPAADEKSLSGELQGGLSGLYSRFRTSVGGVRDMVSGGRSSDKASAETSGLKSPPSERSLPKSTQDSTVSLADSQQLNQGSSQGSRVHSPVSTTNHSFHDGPQPAGVNKGSKLSSKAASISSKASVSPSPAIKSPVPPLTKTTTSSATADPTVTELRVNAVKEPSNDTVNAFPPFHQTVDSASIDKDDGSLNASMSSSGWSQRLTQSPVLQAKTPGNVHDGAGFPEFSRSSTMGSVATDGSRGHDGQMPRDSDVAFSGPARRNKRSVDGSQDATGGSFNLERVRSNSGASFIPARSAAASVSSANNALQFPPVGESAFLEEQATSAGVPSAPLKDDGVNPEESSKEPPREHQRERSVTSGSNLFSGNTPSQASVSEAPSGRPTVPRIDTHVQNIDPAEPHHLGHNAPRDRRAHLGDGMIPQPRSKLLSKEYWMRDENAKDCFHCGEPFSTFRRKHHCRTCGQIFDSKCTLLIPGERFGQQGTIRVCKPCEAMINGNDDDSSEFSDSEQSPIAANPRVSELSTGYPRAGVDDDAASIASQSMEHVIKTPTMAIPATRRTGDHNRRSAVLEISPDRPLARPTSSRSLKSSLSGRPHSMGHKRHHSRQQFIRSFKSFYDDEPPFQRRHVEDTPSGARLPPFHKDNIIDPDLAQYLSDDASSGDEQPSLVSAVSEGSLSKSGGEIERSAFGGLLAAMKKGRSAFDRSTVSFNPRDADDASISSSRAVNLPRPRRRNLSIASSVHQRHSPRASKDSIYTPHEPSIFPTGLGPSGFAMTRSSSMRGVGAPSGELSKASLQHVNRLLRQLLNDSSIPHAQSWETALLPILLKAADDVDPDVQHGDDMDIRHYIKLKKILGGRPGDTSYVSGLVFTKNLALKSMPRSIPRPKIVIIGFPLEYARHQQHFMSLEPVIRQEREFLENLVSRIAALRPNLLLVEKNVSGLALELLEKANIATAYNVKSSVLEAVSRCTQTRIITSMDKLVTTPVHSECGSFNVKTYIYKGRRKTYMYLSGCHKELGCTIVLRGGNHEVLAKVKRITEFMTYVVYNLKLETQLLREGFAQVPTSPQLPAGNNEAPSCTSSVVRKSEETSHALSPTEQDTSGVKGEPSHDKPTVTSEATEVPDDVPMPTYYQDIISEHETKILSASPLVKFEPPYLLMRAREMERRLAYLKRLRDQDFSFDQSDEKLKPQKFVLITPEMVHESPKGASPKVKEVLHAAHDAEYDRAMHNYQTQKRQWEAYINNTVGLFDPYAHQSISVLFSLVCTSTSVPCSGPDLLGLEFYNEHGGDMFFEPDCTLGQFVEDICVNASMPCDINGCEKRIFEHHRQYVQGDAQISIFTEPYPSKALGYENTILMWSRCKICGNETPVSYMSENSWKYSFGKYLELSFWSKNLHARGGVCPHDLQRDHLRYFGFKDVALRIHYDRINLLEIIVPRTRVTWKVDRDLKLRNEVYLRSEQRIRKFMDSVKARLKSINVDSIIPKLADECMKEVDALTRKANEDQATLIRQLQELYTDSRYWEVIPLNGALRSVHEKVVEWDAAFAEFEKNYFPSEKDIRRLASLQLKKIFLDKDASVTSLASSDDQPATPPEAENDTQEQDIDVRPLRRMTLSPEKAQDVLVSVVEEHSGKKDRTATQGAEQHNDEAVESPAPLPSQEKSSPTSMNEEAPQTEEPGLPAQSGKPAEATEKKNLPEADNTPAHSRKNSAELVPSEKESRGSGELERPASQTAASPNQHRSSIPRPTDGGFRRSGKATSPPLLRAQSQPAHVSKERDNSGPKEKKAEFGKPGIDRVTSPPPHETKFKSPEKKLSERLGLGAFRNGKITPGPSLIPRSIPSRKASSRVSYLAKHFEQLSREFERERQRERARRAARGTHSRAYPLASSKPIVEVYKNVREAVEEKEPSGESEDLTAIKPPIPADGSSRGSEDFPERDSGEVQRKERSKPESPAPPDDEKNMPADEHALSEGEAEEVHSDEDRASNDGLQITDSNEELAKLSPDDDQLDLKELPKHERSTLLKLLTNFWSERSASGWAPLSYPLGMSDHVFADCDIIVREDEPSSLIAFALDSQDYQQKLANIQKRYNKLDAQSMQSGEGQESVNEGQEAFKEVQEAIDEGQKATDEGQEPVDEAQKAEEQKAADERRVEQALTRSTGTHLKYQFQEGQAKMLCKVFYAEQFDALRKKCGVADRIIESLSRCAKWDSQGGKTRSLFLKTLDDRFILKSLSPVETQAFLKFAPAYFQIMSEALFHELPSAIAKMFGFYQVIIKNPATGMECNWFLLLMENLFYDRAPQRIFDLKGSMRNRKVQSTGERNEVLLDENMVDFIYETPLFAREHSKKLLSQSVWNDTLFLARQNVMDYSLMIAIDESRSELVVGIIDCIRTYTWDKKLESWIKDRGFAGGGKNRPTVTSPKEYKGRFREAMARYVLQAPSCWSQFRHPMHRYMPVEQGVNQDGDGVDE